MNRKALLALVVLSACAPASRTSTSASSGVAPTSVPDAERTGKPELEAPKTISFASDPSWTVRTVAPVRDGDCDDLALGPAERVCLNSASPSPCPPDAVRYGFVGTAWRADLSPIPGATWIWAPNVVGDTFPADLAQFFFSKKFHLRGRPLSGTVLVAADDFAEVLINGRSAGMTGSITDVVVAGAAQNELVAIDVTAFLHPGENIITIRGQNGPPSFAGSSVPNSYGRNPAAVVFGGTLTYQADAKDDGEDE
jgi:hypothetical protein